MTQKKSLLKPSRLRRGVRLSSCGAPKRSGGWRFPSERGATAAGTLRHIGWRNTESGRDTAARRPYPANIDGKSRSTQLKQILSDSTKLDSPWKKKLWTQPKALFAIRACVMDCGGKRSAMPLSHPPEISNPHSIKLY
jgi:hypothetical protein